MKSLNIRKEETQKKRDDLRQQDNLKENSFRPHIDPLKDNSETLKRSNEKKEHKLRENYNTPGPGQYSITNDLTPEKIKKSYNSISFGCHNTIHNKPNTLLAVPGPGAYNLPKVNKMPSYSFGEKYESPLLKSMMKNRRQLVQNEDHQPEVIGQISCLKQFPGTKMSPPPKPKREKRKEVGPGDYTIPRERLNNFTMAGRNRYTCEEETPGPSTYSIEQSKKYLYPSLHKSFGGLENKVSKECSLESPGPGSYNPKDLRNPCTFKYLES